jgi:hypothetical protein
MTPTNLPATARTGNILARSVALILHCGYLGNHRKVNLGGLDMQKDGATLDREKDELGATKRLFAAKDLTACQKSIASVKDRLRAMSVDGGTRMFGDGAYLIPLGFVPEAIAVIEDGRSLLRANIATLVDRLPALIDERAKKLGPLFVRSEYPTADDIKAAYRVDYNFVSFGAPDQLAEVDESVAYRARQEWDARLSSAYEDVVLGLRESAAAVMGELADRLGAGDDGTPKAIRGTALRDINDLLERLPVLNSIGEDDELAGKLARIGVYLKGIDVEVLRKAPSVRAHLQAMAAETAKDLEALVITGKRAISFGPLPATA